MAQILQIGNFAHSWCSEVHWARTLRQMGHRVLQLSEASTSAEEIERYAETTQADVLIYTRTRNIGDDADKLIALWRRLEAQGVRTCSFHLDLYVGIEREATIEGDPFWMTGTVFTADGSDEAADYFKRVGVNHVWSPPAVMRDECTQGEVIDDLAERPLVFVGSEQYHHEWPNRPDLLRFLRDNWPARFARYGAGARIMRGQDLNNLYASAWVVVGDSLCPLVTRKFDGGEETHRKRNYFSDRYFETVGRGGFLVAPRVPGIEAFLTDGVHYVGYEFGDYEGLRDTINHYLTFRHEGRAIANAGQEHVRKHHTYTNRFADALAVLGVE